MARTTSWKGYLKLSLVSCSVAMAPAQTGTEKIRFNTLNRETGNRLKMQMIDAETGDEVEAEDQVKGYQFQKGQYVQVEQEDLDAVALESRRTIEITQFVDMDDLDPLYMGDCHYLMPEDAVAVEAYTVIREAMERTKVAGIARITVNNRERWVAVTPRGKGILLTTMKYPYEVRDENLIFDRFSDQQPDAQAIDAGAEIIQQMAGSWNPAMFTSRYDEALAAMLKEKQAGHEPRVRHVGEKDAARSTKVVSLLDTLRKAIDAEKAEKREKAPTGSRGGRGKTKAA